jgi:hypothetical protein
MRTTCLLVLLIGLLGCVTPRDLESVTRSATADAVAGIADSVLGSVSPQLARVSESLDGVNQGIDDVRRLRSESGKTEGEDLNWYEWAIIALGGLAGGLGLNNVRNRKYIHGSRVPTNGAS